MNKIKLILMFSALATSVILTSCSDDTVSIPTSEGTPNILFIIADDLGKDAISGFSEGSIKPNTPNIDAIRNNGLSFSNLWVYPTCTPTRASIITGKYGYRTNMIAVGDDLDESEVTLQKYISNNTNNNYASAIVGKWHLSSSRNVDPEIFGIDYYAGLIQGAVTDYYSWRFSENGSTTTQTTYTSELFTDLSIDWIDKQTKPWFLWLAYNAPHTPFHAPPVGTHNQGSLAAYADGADPMPYYMAAIESMDFQIGRLLDSLSEAEKDNTIIIFIGDNGTPNQVAQSPYARSTVKGSLYQGGINTPMFISGKGVSRIGNDDNLINSTDLFSTISQIAGVSSSTIHDSKSFKSLLTQSSRIRDYQYSEMNDGTNDLWTIRNSEYKLIVNTNGNDELYNLVTDPYEADNLLDRTLTPVESDAKVELETELKNIRN